MNMTMFHNTTSDLQDQDHDQDQSVQDQDQDHGVQDQDRLFWSQTSLVLRPTVLDHITARSFTGRAVLQNIFDNDLKVPRPRESFVSMSAISVSSEVSTTPRYLNDSLSVLDWSARELNCFSI